MNEMNDAKFFAGSEVKERGRRILLLGVKRRKVTRFAVCASAFIHSGGL